MSDCREDLVNDLAMWAADTGINIRDAKSDFYILLDKYEITSRCTEIAEIHQDRNDILLKRFLVAKQVQGCTERTLLFYGTEIKKIIEVIGKTVDDVTADDIRLYMARRLRIDKVSKTTVGNETRCLSSFYNWLYTQEIIAKNPMFKVAKIKKEKTKKEALTDMEIEKLRMSVKNEMERAIIEILLSTGCRVTELVNIKLTDIEEERVLVHGKGQKDRYVYLNARAMLALQTYLKERKDTNIYVFPKGIAGHAMKRGGTRGEMANWWKMPENIESEGHLSQGSVESITRRIAKRSGVKKANPHKFRRTCATMALRKGMPIEQVSKMLGHEELSTTQIYLDLTEDELVLAHRKYVV